MASLTPARIAGGTREVGSIEVGKKADLVMTDRELNVVGLGGWESEWRLRGAEGAPAVESTRTGYKRPDQSPSPFRTPGPL